MNLDRRTQVAPPHAGHDVAPMSKHASQSRHNARRRRGRCSDSAVLRVWRMTRALSDLIKLSRRSGKPDATVDRLGETPTWRSEERRVGKECRSGAWGHAETRP